MRIKTLLIGAALLAFASCGGGDGHGVSSDPNAATGFITSNANIPETAKESRDDGILRDADGRPHTYGLLGKSIPEFSGRTVGGGVFSSADITDWTVIYVWGIWNARSITEEPYISEVAARLSLDADMDFMSVHTPASRARADEAFGTFQSVERYFDAKGFSYPAVLDTDASLRNTLQVGWTPSYLLVSPDGVVRGFRTDLSVAGQTPVDDFLADIATVRAEHADIKPRQRSLLISPNGAGGLSGMTPFRLNAIERAFPDHQIVSAKAFAEGDAYPIFNVIGETPEDGPLFTIWPNWNRGHVGIIETSNKTVLGPRGSKIGWLLFGELQKEETERCYDGTDDFENSIICNIGEDRSFQYVFSPGRGDEDTSLRDAPPDVRARAVLSKLRYFPPTPETH